MPCSSVCCSQPVSTRRSSLPPVADRPDLADGKDDNRPCDSTDKTQVELKCTNEGTESCCANGAINTVTSGRCCDESCLQAIALRTCREDHGKVDHVIRERPVKSSLDSTVSRNSTSSVDEDSVACGHHTRSASERYGPTLEALGCICKAILGLGLESCCSSRRPRMSSRSVERSSSRPSLRPSPTSSAQGTSSGSLKLNIGCCSKNKTTPKKNSKKHCDSDQRTSSNDGSGPLQEKSLSSKNCCTVSEKGIAVCTANRGDRWLDPGCCDPSESQEKPPCESEPDGLQLASDLVSPEADVEKGEGIYEHVILSVQNMTCSGCETKLSRSLSSIPSVKNVQASLLLSRAEFDVNTSVISIDGLIAQIKRLTGFSAEVITGDEHEIEVRVTGDPKIFIGQILPAGVLDVTVVDKDIVRIRYDFQVTGARDLLERGFDNPLQIAPVRPHPSIAAGIKDVRHVGLMTLLSILLTIPVLVLAWAPLPRHELIYGSVSLALATIIQVFIAGPFYPSALKSLIFARVIEMDLLIVMSTSAAYIFSVVAFGYLASGNPLSTGEFFETSTLLVSLIMVGRFVCALARQKAIESISIRSLQDYTAILVTDAGEKKIDARLLQYGDIFKVAPDTRIATDGTVIAGVTETDESMMTGETKLIEKKVGSSVVAGSVNGSGSIEVRVTRLLGNNTISTIANMVDEAKLSKPRIQEIADRVASYFVPVILALAVLTFSIWVGLGIELRGQSGSEAVIQAITYAIAVLIVSCPCAIGLAVPMVIVIASGVAADHGVILKTANAIEIARKVSYVVFDKTGTLTQGRLSVVVEDYLKETEDSILGLLLGLISDIKHPVSVAVASHLKAGGTRPGKLDRIEALVGKGVEGWLQDTVIRAGNSRWLGFEAHPQVQSLLSRGLTVFCVAINDDLRAVYGLEDTLRPDAKAVVSALVSHGISVSIVSGDDDGAVQAVASVVGIEPCNAKSRYTPANKQAYIKALTEKGDSNRGSNRSSRNSSVVLFCGDGTNDAVALAQATVGIHMNEGGTDIAQGAADVVLMRPALTGILTLVDLSRAACLRIVFNFSWAFTYNLFAVLLAAGAFVNVRIPPQYAGLGELVSVLPVIAIALQLRYFKPRAL